MFQSIPHSQTIGKITLFFTHFFYYYLENLLLEDKVRFLTRGGGGCFKNNDFFFYSSYTYVNKYIYVYIFIVCLYVPHFSQEGHARDERKPSSLGDERGPSFVTIDKSQTIRSEKGNINVNLYPCVRRHVHMYKIIVFSV